MTYEFFQSGCAELGSCRAVQSGGLDGSKCPGSGLASPVTRGTKVRNGVMTDSPMGDTVNASAVERRIAALASEFDVSDPDDLAKVTWHLVTDQPLLR